MSVPATDISIDHGRESEFDHSRLWEVPQPPRQADASSPPVVQMGGDESAPPQAEQQRLEDDDQGHGHGGELRSPSVASLRDLVAITRPSPSVPPMRGVRVGGFR